MESPHLLGFLHRSAPDLISSGEGAAGGPIGASHLRIHFLGSILLHLSFLRSVKSQQPVKRIVTCALPLLGLQNSLRINTLQLATWKTAGSLRCLFLRPCVLKGLGPNLCSLLLSLLWATHSEICPCLQSVPIARSLLFLAVSRVTFCSCASLQTFVVGWKKGIG